MGLEERDKLKGLNEKYILKRMMDGILPQEVIYRPKQAYRAPVATSLLSESAPEYLREMISRDQIGRLGIFRQDSVEKLLAKIESGAVVTENDHMALAGILSTQIIVDLFIAGNNPFRETGMRTECPVFYDQQVITTVKDEKSRIS